jgi:hypothetical protein
VKNAAQTTAPARTYGRGAGRKAVREPPDGKNQERSQDELADMDEQPPVDDIPDRLEWPALGVRVEEQQDRPNERDREDEQSAYRQPGYRVVGCVCHQNPFLTPVLARRDRRSGVG